MTVPSTMPRFARAGLTAALGRSLLLALACAAWITATGCTGNDATPVPGAVNVPAVGEVDCRVRPNAPRCACANEGRRIACGKVTSVSATGAVTCGSGGQVCQNGAWSECELGAFVDGPTKPQSLHIQALGSPSACPDNPCDPYCRTAFDDTDGGLSGGDGGYFGPDSSIVVGDGGLTLAPPPPDPDASPEDFAVLQDGGLGDANFLFWSLASGAVAPTPNDFGVFDAGVAGGDLYFLIDETATMRDEIQALASAIASDGGIADTVRDTFRGDVNMGVGAFGDYHYRNHVADDLTNYPLSGGFPPMPPNGAVYPRPPGSESSVSNVPYRHLLSMQPSEMKVADTVGWLLGNAYGPPPSYVPRRNGGDIPEAAVSALWSATTGYGLFQWFSGGNTWWWVNPRTSAWSSPAGTLSGSDSGPCTATTTLPYAGYPCWRDLTTPIFLVFTDAPTKNGPGGMYAPPMSDHASLGKWLPGARYLPRADQFSGKPFALASNEIATTFTAANDTDHALATDDVPSLFGAGTTRRLRPSLYRGTVPKATAPACPGCSPTNSAAGSVAVGGGRFAPSASGSSSAGVCSSGLSGRSSVRDCRVTGNTYRHSCVPGTTITTGRADGVVYGTQDMLLPKVSFNEKKGDVQVTQPVYPAAECRADQPTGGAFTNTGSCSQPSYSAPSDSPQLPVAVGATLDFTIPNVGDRFEIVLRVTAAQSGGQSVRLRCGVGPNFSAFAVSQTSYITNTSDWTGFRTTLAPDAPTASLVGPLAPLYAATPNTAVRCTVQATGTGAVPSVDYKTRVSVEQPMTCAGGVSSPPTYQQPRRCCPCHSGYAYNASGNCCVGYNPSTQPTCGPGATYSSLVTNTGPTQATPLPPSVPTSSPLRTTGTPWFPYMCVSCSAYSVPAGEVGPVTASNGPSGLGCYTRSCTVPFAWDAATQTNSGAASVGGPGWSLVSAQGAYNTQTGQNDAFYCRPPTANDSCSAWCGYGLCSGAGAGCGCRPGTGAFAGVEPPLPAGAAPPTGLLAFAFNSSPGSSPSTYTTPLGGFPANTQLRRGFADFLLPSSSWRGLSTYVAPSTFLVNWAQSSPDETLIAIDSFSTRFLGRLTAPCTGTYTFASDSSDSAFLWIDGTMLLATFEARNTLGSSFRRSASIQLSAGAHDLKFEQAEAAGVAHAGLLWSATCTAPGVSGTLAYVPGANLSPTYVGPNGGVPYSQCLTAATASQASYTTGTTGCVTESLGEGAYNAESIYSVVVPKGQRLPYHFSLLNTDHYSDRQAPDPDGSSASTTSNTFLYLVRESDALAASSIGPTGSVPVTDCNKNASVYFGSNRGVVAEIDGVLDNSAGAQDERYYLVVDNANGSAIAYNYLLQVGQFDDLPNTTGGNAETHRVLPTYEKTVEKLNAMGAKVIGVESSGVACCQAQTADPAAQDATEWLDQIARDTGTVDGTTGRPFTIHLRNNATKCDDPTVDATTALTSAVKDALRQLVDTLRQDLVVRAVPVDMGLPGDDTTFPLFPQVERFIAEVKADPLDSAYPPGRCAEVGAPDNNRPLLFDTTPPDATGTSAAAASRQMYRQCLPKTNVNFKVRLQAPVELGVTPYDRYYAFDLVVRANAAGIVARQRVVMKILGSNGIGGGDFTRIYKNSEFCPPGSRATWSLLHWRTTTPHDTEVKFFVQTGASLAALTPEFELDSAHRAGVFPPPRDGDTQVSTPDRDVGAALVGRGVLPDQEYLVVRFNLRPSQNSVFVPILHDWRLSASCPPLE